MLLSIFICTGKAREQVRESQHGLWRVVISWSFWPRGQWHDTIFVSILVWNPDHGLCLGRWKSLWQTLRMPPCFSSLTVRGGNTLTVRGKSVCYVTGIYLQKERAQSPFTDVMFLHNYIWLFLGRLCTFCTIQRWRSGNWSQRASSRSSWSFKTSSEI